MIPYRYYIDNISVTSLSWKYLVASRIRSRHCDKGSGLEKCSLGSVLGSMLALGHASGGPMCPKGGLDPFWVCFGGEMGGPGFRLGCILDAF